MERQEARRKSQGAGKEKTTGGAREEEVRARGPGKPARGAKRG